MKIIKNKFLAVFLVLLLLPKIVIADENTPYFTVITGTVIEIHISYIDPPHKNLVVSLGNSIVSVNIFSDEAIIIGNNEIELNNEIAILVPSLAPVTLSYPRNFDNPIIVNAPFINIFGDIFYEEDDRLTSYSNRLLLNIEDETLVEDAFGNQFTGSLDGEKLIVFYDISTRSIPAIAVPSRIIVLDSSYTTETPEEVDFTNYPIILNNSVGLTENFINVDGAIYVPLRAVAEALGFEVGWNALTGEVTLSLEEEVFSFIPERILDSTSYASLPFFREVLMFNNAYFHGGHVQINNEEPMN